MTENVEQVETEQPEPATETEASHTQNLVGIKGWLLLPAIGFILGPIVGAISLINALGVYPAVVKTKYAGVFTLELLVIAGLLVFMIYVAILFFKKNRSAPSTIITLMVVNLVSALLLLVIELNAGADAFAAQSGKQVIRSIISAAIWIPYFRMSKRVKATFVN